MWTKANIFRFIKMLVVVLPLVFVLASCCEQGANQQKEKTDVELADSHGECWQESILTSLYNAMGTMAMSLYSDITKGALALEMIGFALWFAMRLFRFVGSIKPENAGEVWNEILKKIFICLFCGTLASSTAGTLWVLNTFIFPIYNAFLEFGAEILGSVGNDLGNDGLNEVRVLGFPVKVTKAAICKPINTRLEATLDGFPASPLAMMNCMICSLNERLSIGYYISFRVLRACGFMMTINGLILLVTFTVLKLSFVFYLVDNVFKFAVIIVLMPILILFYPFQKKWAYFGIKTILSSAAFMMGISLMIAVAMKTLIEVIVQKDEVFNPADSEAAVNETGGVVLAILLLAFLIWSTIKVAREITSTMVDAKVDNNFQQKLLGVGLMLLGWVTMGAASSLAKVKALQKAQALYQKTAFARKALEVRKKYAEVSDKLDEWAGRKEQ